MNRIRDVRSEFFVSPVTYFTRKPKIAPDVFLSSSHEKEEKGGSMISVYWQSNKFHYQIYVTILLWMEMIQYCDSMVDKIKRVHVYTLNDSIFLMTLPDSKAKMRQILLLKWYTLHFQAFFDINIHCIKFIFVLLYCCILQLI